MKFNVEPKTCRQHAVCWVTPICTTHLQIKTCTTRTPPEPHTQKPLFKLKTAAKHHSIRPPHHMPPTQQTTQQTCLSLTDLPGRTLVDDVHSESNSSAVEVEGGDACMQSSPAEDQRQQEEQQQQQQQGEGAAGRETTGGEEGDAPEEIVRIPHLYCMQHGSR